MHFCDKNINQNNWGEDNLKYTCFNPAIARLGIIPQIYYTNAQRHK